MRRRLRYSVVDVFAERALEGNALAVFEDARGLTAARMQAIAREMNLSETAFVLPDTTVDERDEGVRVRIFTTEEELPFAGHPTLGTASWLHAAYPPVQGAGTVRLRLDAGVIPVEFQIGDSWEAAGLYGTMRQIDPAFGAPLDRAEVAAAMGLKEGDLLGTAAGGPRPMSVSTGNAFCIVALRDVATLGHLRIDQARSTPWLRDRGMRWFYAVAPEVQVGGPGAVWRARMQFYGGEDPATGSAAGPCAAWLVHEGLAASGAPIVVRQGVEVGRPSRLIVQASLRNVSQGCGVTGVLVGGRTIPVAAGEFLLPG